MGVGGWGGGGVVQWVIIHSPEFPVPTETWHLPVFGTAFGNKMHFDSRGGWGWGPGRGLAYWVREGRRASLLSGGGGGVAYWVGGGGVAYWVREGRRASLLSVGGVAYWVGGSLLSQRGEEG